MAISPPFNSSHVYQYAHFLNYRDAPQAFPLMESLDCVQPGSRFLTVGLSVSSVHIRPPTSEEKRLSNNKIIHTSNLTHKGPHTQSWQLQHLSAFPFNCQINICSCQSPTHRIICAFSLCLAGLAFQGVTMGCVERLGLLASGRLRGQRSQILIDV